MRFTGWQVVALCGLAVSPFWAFASNWRDLSEATATVVGGSLVTVVGGIMWLVGVRRRGD